MQLPLKYSLIHRWRIMLVLKPLMSIQLLSITYHTSDDLLHTYSCSSSDSRNQIWRTPLASWLNSLRFNTPLPPSCCSNMRLEVPLCIGVVALAKQIIPTRLLARAIGCAGLILPFSSDAVEQQYKLSRIWHYGYPPPWYRDQLSLSDQIFCWLL